MHEIILVKHALPVLEAGVPAREWRLAPEGEAQARRLAARLRPYLPFELASSHEPKAQRTTDILATELGVSFKTQAGLEEFDRPALPVLPAAEHASLNAPIFGDLSRPVLGSESGAVAMQRFRAAVSALADARSERRRLVVVSHGTVIALLVSAHNDVDGFKLWQELSCASFLVLCYPGFELVSGVEPLH